MRIKIILAETLKLLNELETELEAELKSMASGRSVPDFHLDPETMTFIPTPAEQAVRDKENVNNLKKRG